MIIPANTPTEYGLRLPIAIDTEFDYRVCNPFTVEGSDDNYDFVTENIFGGSSWYKYYPFVFKNGKKKNKNSDYWLMTFRGVQIVMFEDTYNKFLDNRSPIYDESCSKLDRLVDRHTVVDGKILANSYKNEIMCGIRMAAAVAANKNNRPAFPIDFAGLTFPDGFITLSELEVTFDYNSINYYYREDVMQKIREMNPDYTF